MHTHADPEKDRPFDVMKTILPRSPWRVAEVEALDRFQLRVRFVDGSEGLVDMAGLVRSPDAGVFAALRDERLFREVRVEIGAVTWPGGLDLAPDAMHEAIRQHGKWVIA